MHSEQEGEEGGWIDGCGHNGKKREGEKEGGREGDACEIGLDQRDFLNQRREREGSRLCGGRSRGTDGLNG